jgi:hypothetical protein
MLKGSGMKHLFRVIVLSIFAVSVRAQSPHANAGGVTARPEPISHHGMPVDPQSLGAMMVEMDAECAPPTLGARPLCDAQELHGIFLLKLGQLDNPTWDQALALSVVLVGYAKLDPSLVDSALRQPALPERVQDSDHDLTRNLRSTWVPPAAPSP